MYLFINIILPSLSVFNLVNYFYFIFICLCYNNLFHLVEIFRDLQEIEDLNIF